MAKKKTQKKYNLRKVDNELWKQIQDQAKGGVDKKLKAIEAIFSKQYSLPIKSMSIVLSLAKPDQPKKIRLKIAKCLSKYSHIPYGMYTSLIFQLSKDTDKEIQKIISTEKVKMGFGIYALNFNSLSPSLRGIASSMENLSKSLTPTFKHLSLTESAIIAAMGPNFKTLTETSRKLAPSISSTMQRISTMQKAFSSSISPQILELAKQRKGILSLATSLPTRQLLGITTMSDQLQKEISRKILEPTKSFYPPNELQVLKKPVKIPSETRAKKLSDKLKNCQPGKKHWGTFQEICGEILSYCFSPQLLEPFPQDETREGLHKRDYVYPFSQELRGFWKFVQTKFGMGLGVVVECKNYSNLLKENEVIITSKYLGPKKYTAFGLILTRKGLHNNGKKAIIKKWEENGIMILCLKDSDLLKMLELKGRDDEATKVIQNALDQFLRSLE